MDGREKEDKLKLTSFASPMFTSELRNGWGTRPLYQFRRPGWTVVQGAGEGEGVLCDGIGDSAREDVGVCVCRCCATPWDGMEGGK